MRFLGLCRECGSQVPGSRLKNLVVAPRGGGGGGGTGKGGWVGGVGGYWLVRRVNCLEGWYVARQRLIENIFQ